MRLTNVLDAMPGSAVISMLLLLLFVIVLVSGLVTFGIILIVKAVKRNRTARNMTAQAAADIRPAAATEDAKAAPAAAVPDTSAENVPGNKEG